MPCPICRTSTHPAYRPFCSRRCADLDLARWLSGGYALPGPPAEAEEEAPPRPGADEP